MKKCTALLSFLLVFALLISILSACSSEKGQTGEQKTTVAQKSEAKASQTEKKPVKGKITFWTAWGEDLGPKKWVEEFNKVYPEVEVTNVLFKNTDEGNIKIDTSLLAGQEIDLFFSYSVERYAPRVKKGLTQELTEYLAKDGIDVKKDFSPSTFQIDGKYFGLPTTSVSDAMAFNMKIFEDAKVSIPDESWTMDDYVEISKKLTRGEGDKKIFGSCYHKDKYYWTYPARGLLGNNAWYNDKGLSNFDHPAYKKSLEIKHQLEYVAKTQMPTLELQALQMTDGDAFVKGNIGMLLFNSSRSRWLSDVKKYPRDFKVTFRPFPVLEKGQKQNYIPGMRLFGYLGMSAKSKNKDAAWAFMKWLSTDGAANIAQVGHIPTYKKTKKDDVIKIMFNEEALKTIEVDAFKKYVLDYESPCYNDSEFTAYSQLYTISSEEAEKALVGEKSIADAITSMKKRSDEVITKEKGK